MSRLLVRAAAMLLLTLPAAHAAGTKGADLDFYAGEFSYGRDSDARSVEMGMEYRYRDVFYGLRPTVGAMVNTDSAFHGYAGINWDLPLGIAPIYITPGVKFGGYSAGDSKKLGSGAEFRDSLEATYRFNDGERAGAAISHISNAGIGSKNPGVEMIELVYSHPI